MSAVGYWWLLYRPLAKPRLQFLLEFGREPERCDWDENECCWWIGPVTLAELAGHRKRAAKHAGQMALPEPAGG